MCLNIFSRLLPVILLQCHALLIHRPLHFALAGEDAFVLQDDALHQIVDLRLQGDHVFVLSPSHQAGAETHSQVVRLHHVLVAVLRHTGGREHRHTRTLHNKGEKGGQKSIICPTFFHKGHVFYQ